MKITGSAGKIILANFAKSKSLKLQRKATHICLRSCRSLYFESENSKLHAFDSLLYASYTIYKGS
ncbi:unnamed protein product, partial [Ceratitis capitata]